MHERVVHVKRGQRVVLDNNRQNGGVRLVLEHEQSGAFIVRNELSGRVLRQWSPKEAKSA